MTCLPGSNTDEELKFGPDINFASTPSLAFPPNMLEIMNLANDPNAFKPSPNLAIIDQIESQLASSRAFWDTLDMEAPGREDALDLYDNRYRFNADVRFNKYTEKYDVRFPPLLSRTGGIQTVLNTIRTHIDGIANVIPGAIGSLGALNRFRTFGFLASGNALQQHLGLGAIPDCGLMD